MEEVVLGKMRNNDLEEEDGENEEEEEDENPNAKAKNSLCPQLHKFFSSNAPSLLSCCLTMKSLMRWMERM